MSNSKIQIGKINYIAIQFENKSSEQVLFGYEVTTLPVNGTDEGTKIFKEKPKMVTARSSFKFCIYESSLAGLFTSIILERRVTGILKNSEGKTLQSSTVISPNSEYDPDARDKFNQSISELLNCSVSYDADQGIVNFVYSTPEEVKKDFKYYLMNWSSNWTSTQLACLCLFLAMLPLMWFSITGNLLNPMFQGGNQSQ